MGEDVPSAKANSTIRVTNERHAYLRNEPLVFQLSGVPNAKLRWRICDEVQGKLETENDKERVVLPPNALKSGAYTLDVMDGDKVLLSWPFTVSLALSSERLRHLLWPDDRMGQLFADTDDGRVGKAIEFFRDLGFTDIPVHPPKSATQGKDVTSAILEQEKAKGVRHVPPTALAQVQRTLDLMTTKGVASGLRGVPFLVPEDEKRRIQNADGSYSDKFPNPWNSDNIEEDNARTQELIEALRQYPSVQTFFVSTEVQWPIDLSPPSQQRIREELGFLPSEIGQPQFVQEGVLSDQDKGYRYHRYFFKRGQGDVVRNERIARLVKSIVPRVLVWSDPYRLASVYDFFRGQDIISTWTYTNPDPKYMFGIEHLIAAAKPSGQKVMHTVTLLNWPGSLKPGKPELNVDEFINMSPDRYRICQWINLSRRPDFLCTYFSQALNPLNEDAASNPFRYVPEMLDAMRQFDKEVVRPLGPILNHVERAPRTVAVFDSTAARLYGKVPRGPGYYANYEIYDLGAVLAMAQIPFDVVFDETLEQGGLVPYEMVVIPKADVITESAFKALEQFQKRGGVVVVDPHFKAPLPGVVRLDWDLLYRNHVNANSLATGKTVKERDDIGKNKGEEATEGVTAGEDQKRMERFAADLKAKLDGKFTRDLDADSPCVLLNRLRSGSVDYIVAINDRRTYDDRTGQWKAMLDKGLPLETTIRFKTSLPNPAVYDVLSGGKVHSETKDGWVTIKTALSAAGGKMFAVQPTELGALRIEMPKTLTRGRSSQVIVTIPQAGDGNAAPGVQSIQVRVLTPDGKPTDDSGCYAVVNGSRVIEIAPALNDPPGTWTIEVFHPATGKRQTMQFKVM